jgi:outer membrane protein TolC
VNIHRLSLFACIALLGACASYAPKPRSSPGATLTAPNLAVLSADAATIDRPFLKPQPIDLTQPLTPNALAIIAVLESPDLKAQRAKLGVTDAQAFAARLLPDPTVQLGFDKLLSGPDAYNGFAGQIAADINAIRAARATREASEASKRQVRLDLAWAEWQAAGQARLQGVRIVALEKELTIAQASADATEQTLAAAMRAALRGDISGAEADSRRQAALDAADKARTARRDLVTARSELNKLLGLPPETMLKLAPPAPVPTPPPVEQLVARALDRRLDLQALRAGYASAEAEVHKAVIEQFPTLSLALVGARDTSNNHTLGPQVGFTLPLWNRNRGNIAIAKATREQLHAEYNGRVFQTRAEIDAAVAGIAAVEVQRKALVAQMPAIARVATGSERAALRGDLSQAVAATAQQVLRDRQLALLVLDQQRAEQVIALELLSGELSEGWDR